MTVQNRTHVYMNFFDHKDLGNHLLQLYPKVVKHSVYTSLYQGARANAHAYSHCQVVKWRLYRRSRELCITDKERKPSRGASIGVSANP
jgi:hypothetical protein